MKSDELVDKLLTKNLGCFFLIGQLEGHFILNSTLTKDDFQKIINTAIQWMAERG